VKYQFLPDVDQDELPIFDEVDAIEDINRMVYGVDNFFNLFDNYASGNSILKDYAYVQVSQYYDLRDDYAGDSSSDVLGLSDLSSATNDFISDDSDGRFSDIFLRTGWTPTNYLTVEYQTDLDAYGDGFVAHSLEGTYRTKRGDHFSLDYSFNDDSSIEQINGIIRTHLLNNWFTLIDVEHSISNDETQEATVSLTYQALCWSVSLESNYTPEDTAFMVVFNLANIGGSPGLGD
jgi:LPS-assembly protein